MAPGKCQYRMGFECYGSLILRGKRDDRRNQALTLIHPGKSPGQAALSSMTV
jgi:hypothetical protein